MCRVSNFLCWILRLPCRQHCLVLPRLHQFQTSCLDNLVHMIVLATVHSLKSCKSVHLSPCTTSKADRMDKTSTTWLSLLPTTANVTQNRGSAFHGDRPADAVRQSVQAFEAATLGAVNSQDGYNTSGTGFDETKNICRHRRPDFAPLRRTAIINTILIGSRGLQAPQPSLLSDRPRSRVLPLASSCCCSHIRQSI